MGEDKQKIVEAVQTASSGIKITDFGNGDAAIKIVQILETLNI